jgi:CheY-like chemotaxis protein
MTPARILVVEDNRVVARDIERQVARIGHTVVGVAASGELALGLAAATRPHLVLMDIHIEGSIDGIEAAQRLRARAPIGIIFVTAYADDETMRRARVTEPLGYLLKPFIESELRSAIDTARNHPSAAPSGDPSGTA